MSLSRLRTHALSVVGIVSGVASYAAVEPEGTPDVVYIVPAAAGLMAGYGLTYLVHKISYLRAHRHEQALVRTLDVRGQMDRVVELANQQPLTGAGLHRTVMHIRQLRQLHGDQISSARAAGAVAELARHALYLRTGQTGEPGNVAADAGELFDALGELLHSDLITPEGMTGAVSAIFETISLRAANQARADFYYLVDAADAALRRPASADPPKLDDLARRLCLAALGATPSMKFDLAQKRINQLMLDMHEGDAFGARLQVTLKNLARLRTAAPWLDEWFIRNIPRDIVPRVARALGPELEAHKLCTLLRRVQAALKSDRERGPERAVMLAQHITQRLGDRMTPEKMDELLRFLNVSLPAACHGMQRALTLVSVLAPGTPSAARQRVCEAIHPEVEKAEAVALCQIKTSASKPCEPGSVEARLLEALEQTAMDPRRCMTLIGATLEAAGWTGGVANLFGVTPDTVAAAVDRLAHAPVDNADIRERDKCIAALMCLTQDHDSPRLLAHALYTLERLPEFAEDPEAAASSKLRRERMAQVMEDAVRNACTFIEAAAAMRDEDGPGAPPGLDDTSATRAQRTATKPGSPTTSASELWMKRASFKAFAPQRDAKSGRARSDRLAPGSWRPRAGEPEPRGHHPARPRALEPVDKAVLPDKGSQAGTDGPER